MYKLAQVVSLLLGEDYGRCASALRWWPTNFSFWNCPGAFTSQFVYSAGEVPTAEPVASLRGTARKTKWLLWESGAGPFWRAEWEHTKKGTDAREEENKNVACFEDEQETKHLRTRSGAGTQVRELLFPPLLPKNHTTRPTSTNLWLEASVNVHACHHIILSYMYVYISIY